MSVALLRFFKILKDLTCPIFKGFTLVLVLKIPTVTTVSAPHISSTRTSEAEKTKSFFISIFSFSLYGFFGLLALTIQIKPPLNTLCQVSACLKTFLESSDSSILLMPLSASSAIEIHSLVIDPAGTEAIFFCQPSPVYIVANSISVRIRKPEKAVDLLGS